LKLEWKSTGQGEVAEGYSIDARTSRLVVYHGDRKIGTTTSIEIAREMAQRHADVGSSALYR
jgi:hypothetical protein